MTVLTWEVKARIFLHGILIVGGTLHRTNSELMFMANKRPGRFRTVRWSSPLSEVVAIRAIPRYSRPFKGLFRTGRVEIQTEHSRVVMWLKNPARLLDDSSGPAKTPLDT
jgi:hypothetical protein